MKYYAINLSVAGLLLLCAVRCTTVSEKYLQAPEFAGSAVDPARDTLLRTAMHSKSGRIEYQILSLNGRRLFILDYDYDNSGSYRVHTRKGFLKPKEGISYAFYPDGKLWGKVPIKNGKPEGMSYNFYPTGELEAEVPYRSGQKHGTARFYWPNGQLYGEFDYEKNRLHAVHGLFDRHANPLPTGTFKNGNGELLCYDDAGEKVERVDIYRNGKKKSTRLSR